MIYMNYQNIYNNFLNLIKTTTPRERLIKRDQNDERLLKQTIYTEKHHIIPRSLGGKNNKENIVELLFEEHIFIHLLRYKIFGHKEDFYAVRLMVQTKNSIPNKITKMLNQPLKHYGRWKHFIMKERYKNGYFQEETKLKIQKARKDTFPCIDTLTGKMMGQFNKNHPKIIQGEWVHHSKGKIQVILKSTGEKLYIPQEERRKNPHLYIVNKGDMKGNKNPNYKEMTEDRLSRILKLVPISLFENSTYVNQKKFIENLKKEMNEFKKISYAWLKNNFGINYMNYIVSNYNEKYGTHYNYSSYFRGYKKNNGKN